MTSLMKKFRKDNLQDNRFNTMLKEQEWAQGASPNTIISAEVKDIDYNGKKVIVYTGFKSNSSINFQEFKINGEDNIPKIGDFINVIVKGIDEETGCVITSFKEVKIKERTAELEAIFQNKESIEGVFLYKIKSNHVKYNSYAVDLGYGIIGLLTINDYNTEVHIGDKVTVEIVKFEQKKFGIILQKKNNQETNFTQEKIVNNEKYNIGQKIKIKITEIKEFCIIGEDINSKAKNNSIFVHSSELFWNKRNRNSQEISKNFTIGNEVEVMVIGFDNIKNRYVFSVRALYNNFFEEFQNYIKNSNTNKIEGIILEKRNDSFIVGIPFMYKDSQGNQSKQFFEGRLYVKDLSWNYNECIKKQRELLVDSKIECIILPYDSSKYQVEDGFFFIPLSVKDLTTDPFLSGLELVQLGKMYNCYFVEYNDYYNGFLVKLEVDDKILEDLTVIIKTQNLGSLQQVKNCTNLKGFCKVIKIDNKDKIVFASIKAAESENKENILKEYDLNNRQKNSTLGSILKDN
jgi:ribosomal protein S1